MGRYLFFIRPRRFGKSLFLSMMAAYYDILFKGRFKELFKGTTIYENPTEEQSKYMVLSLNFSQVDTGENKLEGSFLNHVRGLAVDFVQRYRDHLSANPRLDYYSETIDTGTSAADILSNLVILCRGAKLPVYLIIDEYDNFAKLKQIIEEGGTLSNIADGFPLEEMTDTNNFKSLLFYFGLLTITGREGNLYRLQIPNETIKRLYFDYISEAYRETGVFSIDLSKYSILMINMAFKGSWRPLLEFITGRMKECLALRDLITGKKAVQTFLNVYLSLSDLFIVHSEKEMNKGFADLLLAPYTAKYPALNVSFLLELKYMKAGMSPEDPKLPQLIAEAEKQLNDYSLDEEFNKTVGKTQLIKLIMVFPGHEAIYIEQIPSRL
jgi:hypothetical protein